MVDGCTDLEVVTIDTPGLGDRSYIATGDGWAVAVDPQRDIDRVELVLATHGLRLGAVLETHIHNDYITGGLALARRHRVPYVVPAGPRLGYAATRVGDGDRLAVGPLAIGVIDSAGHTDAHAAYEVRLDGAASGAAFTGGSLLLGATGRTDLLGPDLAEALARRQHRSVRRLATLLPGDTRLCPTHGFGSYCTAGHSAGGGASLADQLAVNPAFLLEEDAFVAASLGGLGPYPRYFALMGPRNAGLPDATSLDPVPEVTVRDILAGRVTDADTVVLDVRPRDRWARGHVAGSVAIDGAGAVATWFGWVASIEADVVLVADEPARADAARRELARIGVDGVRAACIAPELATGRDPRLRSTRRATFADLAASEPDPDRVVLDVRERGEWTAGHLAGAVHVPAHALATVDPGPFRGRDVWVHCAAGFRASVAASLLERQGIVATVVDDDFAAAPAAGLRLARRSQPASLAA